MACKDKLPSRVLVAKALLRFLGAFVSVAFACQIIWLIRDFKELVDGPFSFFHWLGQFILFLFVGIAGLTMELQGAMKRCVCCVLSMNRLLLALMYLWIGLYVFGAPGSPKRHREQPEVILMVTTAIVAWIVAVSDFVIAIVCPKRYEEGPEERPEEKAGAEAGESPESPRPASGGKPASSGDVEAGESQEQAPAALPHLLGTKRDTAAGEGQKETTHEEP